MKKVSRVMLVAGLVVGLLPLLMGQQGCPTGLDATGVEGTDDLTSLEKQAIVAACSAPGTLTQATDVAKTATDDVAGEQSAQQARDTTFGTCPTVTKTGSLVSDSVTITIDFGSEPCVALMLEDGTNYLCSGLASGAFGLLGRTIGLTFEQIACDDQTLDGSALLTWALSLTGVELEGDWDLLWTIGSDVLGTSGTGKAVYDRVLEGCCDETRIDEFTGNLTDAGYLWSIVMADLKVSLLKYASFIPYSGYVTMDGPDIRPLTITFSENSPTLGEITVTIEPGRTMTISLYELEEWLAMYPIEE